MTIDRLTEFARDTDPLRHPAAAGRARAVADVRGPRRRSRPTLGDFSASSGRLITASVPGLPGARARACRSCAPLLGQLDPALAQLNPVLERSAVYKPELTAFLANIGGGDAGDPVSGGPAALPAHDEPAQPGEPGASTTTRLPTNRPNPYTLPARSTSSARACRRSRRASARVGAPDAGPRADVGIRADAAAAALDPHHAAAVRARTPASPTAVPVPAGADRAGRAVRRSRRAGNAGISPPCRQRGRSAAGRGHPVPAPEGRARGSATG